VARPGVRSRACTCSAGAHDAAVAPIIASGKRTLNLTAPGTLPDHPVGPRGGRRGRRLTAILDGNTPAFTSDATVHLAHRHNARDPGPLAEIYSRSDLRQVLLAEASASAHARPTARSTPPATRARSITPSGCCSGSRPSSWRSRCSTSILPRRLQRLPARRSSPTPRLPTLGLHPGRRRAARYDDDVRVARARPSPGDDGNNPDSPRALRHRSWPGRRRRPATSGARRSAPASAPTTSSHRPGRRADRPRLGRYETIDVVMTAMNMLGTARDDQRAIRLRRAAAAW